MRAFTAVLLTLAAVATAAPSTSPLEARQECIYQCGCSEIDGVPGNTEQCCTTAGGSFDGNLCNALAIPTHTTFRNCCTLGNAVCFAPRGCPF
ncbi:hypothetical protein V8F20_009850 [Naviculisporaceae sp. PSN 640]